MTRTAMVPASHALRHNTYFANWSSGQYLRHLPRGADVARAIIAVSGPGEKMSDPYTPPVDRLLTLAEFAADRVDLTFNGDWEDVQVELGVLPERHTLQPNYMMLEQELPITSAFTELPRPSTGRNAKDRAKSKRKMAKQSRRRNRRRQ